MKKLKYILFMIPILFGFINTVNAASYVPNEFTFIGKSGPGAVWVSPGNNSYGDIHTIMPDITQTTKFLNVVIATSTSVSSDTFKFGGVNFEANYSYMLMPGRNAVVDGYELNVYVIQLSYGYGTDRGCSVSGTTCYNYGVGWFYNRMDYNVVWSVLDVYNSEELLDTSSSAVYEKVDNILQDIGQVNDKLDNIDGSINNSDVDNDTVSSTFEEFNNFLDDNSTITQLITLPITLYTAILNNVGSSCQPFSLGTMYGEELVLPCVNIGNYLGSTVWGMIDLIISGFAIYAISKKLIKVFNTFSSMKEGDVIDD